MKQLSNQSILKTAKANTTFVGSEKNVIDYIRELNDLTHCSFSYKKIGNENWIVSGDVSQESIDKYNLHSDFVIDVPSSLEVYDNGEICSIEFSRKVHSLSFYYYIIQYKGRVYEVEVSDDEISQEVENPNMPARMAII